MDFTTARGKRRLSPRLRLSPTTTAHTVLATTDLVTGLVTATVMDFTTERGKPRLNPRLRLIPTTMAVTTVDSATTDLVTGPTDSGTGPSGAEVPQSLQDLNHRRKTLTLFV